MDAGALIFRIQMAGAAVFAKDAAAAKAAQDEIAKSAEAAAPKAAKLGAEIDKTSAAARKAKAPLEDAAKASKSIGEEAAKAAPKAKTLGAEIKSMSTEAQAASRQVGGAAFGIGAAVGAMVGLTAKAAIDWQTAWTGVTKTVDGTEEELAGIQTGLRGLSKELPASTTEIAAVAEAAGQLGIQTGAVVAFTRTMIDLGETTNLSADEAATALARFMNVMGTSQDKVSNLGSSVVELGNNYATTEAEIVAMASRLSGASRQVGLSEGETLGLAAALSSVGIEAEAGGSAVSKVMIDIAASVDKGGERLDKFATIAGVGADEFAKKWKTAPGAALALFVKGLANAEAQGGSTLGMLEDLGITEVRMRDALLRSAAASDQFTAAMDTGNEAFDDNNALVEEAAKRYDTVASKIQIAGNNVNDAAIEFGEVFLPAIVAVTEGVVAFAGGMADLPGPLKDSIAVLGAVAGGVLLISGAMLIGVPQIAAYRTAITTLTTELPKTAGAARGVATFLTGPWGLAIAAATIILGGLIAQNEAAKKQVELHTSALIENSGALGDNNRQIVINELQSKGAFTAAKELGLGLDTVTDAALGNKDAMKIVQERLDEVAASSEAAAQDQSLYTAAQVEAEGAANTLEKQIGIQNGTLKKAKGAWEEQAEAQGKATPVTLTSADAYAVAEEEAAGLLGTITDLIDKINEANGVGQDAVTTNASYQSSLEDVRDTVAEAKKGAEGYSTSIDETSAAGAENAAMFADLAKESQDAAKAQMGLDGDTNTYLDTLNNGRQTLYDQILALTGNADAAQALTDKIYAIPSEKEVKVIADTAAAMRKLEALRAMFAMPNVVVTADMRDEGGYYTNRADGAVVDYYANGGFNERHVAQIASAGDMRVWAEPETGGEAYIPLSPAKRARSLAIWEETGRRLGVNSYADGAVLGGMLGGSGGGNTYVQVDVHGVPDTDAETAGRVIGQVISEKVGALK